MIYFDFYGFVVELKSSSDELIDIIRKNFSYFESNNKKSSFKITAIIEEDLSSLIPKKLTALKQSINSMTFEQNGLRYNDYYGKAVTIINYKNNYAYAYAKDINQLHEIVYLLIMSRQGKACDKRSLHKIHAMAVSSGKKNLILMLPMKGGKSTMFTKFLSETDHNLISDDSPCINSNGDLLNFPIRFGIENKPMYKNLLEKIESKHVFKLYREQFGEKILVDFKAFENRIKKPSDKNILIQGFRTSSSGCRTQSVSKIKMFKFLFINMTIGVGLPMIIEYFIENTVSDHFGNFLIFTKRLKATLMLLIKSECYFVYLGNDVDLNFTKLNQLLISGK